MSGTIRWPLGEPPQYQERPEFCVLDLEYRMEQASIAAKLAHELAYDAEDAGDVALAERYLAARDAKEQEYRELRAELDDYEGGFSI